MRTKYSSTLLLILGVACYTTLAMNKNDTHPTENFQSFNDDPSISTFQACQEYLNQVNRAIDEQKFKLIPETFKNTVLMSGRQVNDMGQVDECRETDNMTFVRMTTTISNVITVYQGFCFDMVCNAEVLDTNKKSLNASIQMIINSIKRKLVPIIQGNDHFELKSNDHYDDSFTKINILNNSQISVSYQPFYIYGQSKINIAYFIAAISIIACIVAAFGSPLLKKFQTKINKQGDIQQNISSDTNESLLPLPRTRNLPTYLKVLQCWNIKENLKKLFVLKSNNNDLLIFNGIRTLCFMQVVFGHEFYLHMNYMFNPSDLLIEEKKSYILVAFSCLYSVDVFFYLGAFFLAYVVADEKMAKRLSLKAPAKVATGFAFAILNRLFRILPCYFLVLMFFWKIIPYWGASPTWDQFTNQSDSCESRWWQNLLFIDNLVPGSDKCFGWGWYLSNDFQMFLFGMILLIVYANNRRIGKLAILGSFVAFQTVSIVLSYYYNFKVPYSAANLTLPHFFEDYYTKPWTRSPPYFVGLFMGVLYKEYQAEKSKITKKSFFMRIQKAMSSTNLKWISYGIGLIIYGFLVFAPRYLQVNGANAWPDWFQNLWFGTCRTFYVLAVTCFIVPGILGSKDFVVKFLSSKIFAFIQRLSFCGYLTHYMIILYTIWQTRDSVYYSEENLISLFFSEFFLTLLAAGFVTLIIEIPIMNLSGILLGNKKPSSRVSATKPIDINKSKEINS